MQQFMIIFGLAIFVEGTIEYLGVPVPSKYKPYAAAILGILTCLGFGADMFALLGLTGVYPYIGQIATGLVIGRGSNYLNDIWSRLNVVHLPSAPLQAFPSPQEAIAVREQAAVAAPPNVPEGARIYVLHPVEGPPPGEPK